MKKILYIEGDFSNGLDLTDSLLVKVIAMIAAKGHIVLVDEKGLYGIDTKSN